MTSRTLTDRAEGLLLGLACGDALGAPYEFDWQKPPTGTGLMAMIGGGLGDGGTPGGWTDDTAQAATLAEAITGGDPGVDDGMERFAAGLLAWFADRPPNCGFHTTRVLTSAGGNPKQLVHGNIDMETTGGSNGSLMRTAPCALVSPQRSIALRAALCATAVTHLHADAVNACVFWTAACHIALWDRQLDFDAALRFIPNDSPLRRIVIEARHDDPHRWHAINGGARGALATAVACVTRHPDDPVAAITAAVRAGGDTDTTAAIVGALVGALHGASRLPAEWTTDLHGPVYTPDGQRHQYTAADLTGLAHRALTATDAGVGAQTIVTATVTVSEGRKPTMEP